MRASTVSRNLVSNLTPKVVLSDGILHEMEKAPRIPDLTSVEYEFGYENASGLSQMPLSIPFRKREILEPNFLASYWSPKWQPDEMREKRMKPHLTDVK